MPKSLPTDSKIDFLICENARPEQSGKVTLIGYMASAEIQLESNAHYPAGIGIAFLFVLRDGEGTFSGSIEMRAPNQAIIAVTPLPAVIKKAGEANIIINNVPALLLPMPGVYSIILMLDGASYTRTLKIT